MRRLAEQRAAAAAAERAHAVVGRLEVHELRLPGVERELAARHGEPGHVPGAMDAPAHRAVAVPAEGRRQLRREPDRAAEARARGGCVGIRHGAERRPSSDPMGTAQVEAVVVGAGIAGLAAALELQSAGCDVFVVDPSDRPGGVMRTDHRKGYVVESGPSTAVVRAPMLDFLAKRGLHDGLLRAAPASRKRFLYRGGSMIRVPDSPWRIARTPLLSKRAKLRALTEPFRLRGKSETESVAEFIGRRLGREVSASLVGPFLTGVYAGDEEQLGAAAVFPRWVDRERRYGSLALGGLFGLLRRGERGLRGSYATEQGFGPFARRLAEALIDPPALRTRVAWIARDGARWHVDLTSPSGDRAVCAARVVVGAPAYAAADVLRGLDGEIAAALEGIAYAPIVVAPVGIEADAAREPVEGFGFLVAREESLGLLGCLFMSQLFRGRAP